MDRVDGLVRDLRHCKWMEWMVYLMSGFTWSLASIYCYDKTNAFQLHHLTGFRQAPKWSYQSMEANRRQGIVPSSHHGARKEGLQE